MYTRFTVNYKNKNSGVDQGVLGAAFKLKKDDEIPIEFKKSFDDCLNWFQKHLITPVIFELGENKNSVYWFKNTAIEAIKKVRVIIPILQACGLEVCENNSDKPGKIIYEDNQQVVAIPKR
ncbi:hypothetical protein [Parendozoicomonas haliclonae]|uniref:Uncharacterized protein n=1 Tax=Parendozoicomonas haliclonae TaxID=1960125 RepID=A0A1X7AJP2_9GAMM|nr:hypothetical protein [Parendozoicomonas haliclonae]SMA47023.1 hypothetical protein EHSB41UT_02284 [Parendozoicomonas haliclonae]